MIAILKEHDFLKVEIPELDYSEDQLNAVKDITAILLASGLDKYVEIGLPNPRK